MDHVNMNSLGNVDNGAPGSVPQSVFNQIQMHQAMANFGHSVFQQSRNFPNMMPGMPVDYSNLNVFPAAGGSATNSYDTYSNAFTKFVYPSHSNEADQEKNNFVPNHSGTDFRSSQREDTPEEQKVAIGIPKSPLPANSSQSESRSQSIPKLPGISSVITDQSRIDDPPVKTAVPEQPVFPEKSAFTKGSPKPGENDKEVSSENPPEDAKSDLKDKGDCLDNYDKPLSKELTENPMVAEAIETFLKNTMSGQPAATPTGPAVPVKRRQYNREEKIRILDFFHKGHTQYKTCQTFGISTKSLKLWIDTEDRIRNMSPGAIRPGCGRKALYPDVESLLQQVVIFLCRCISIVLYVACQRAGSPAKMNPP